MKQIKMITRKLFSVIIICSLILSGLMVGILHESFAEVSTNGLWDFSYEEGSTTEVVLLSFIKPTGWDGILTIPSTIKVDGVDKTVVSMNYGFASNLTTSLKELKFEAPELTIKREAFMDCTLLTSITFPDGGRYTFNENNTFNGCTSLESVDMSLLLRRFF